MEREGGGGAVLNGERGGGSGEVKEASLSVCVGGVRWWWGVVYLGNCGDVAYMDNQEKHPAT